ncbi:MAG: polysaccharide deacetylase family protein [Candidatus Aquicultor sp.]|nr:polysaccharide deacetylase family protein [Candidatus Aquicultor sp.]
MNKRPFIFILSVVLAIGCLIGVGLTYMVSGSDSVPQPPRQTIREAEALRVARERPPQVVESDIELAVDQEETASIAVDEVVVAGALILPPVLPGLVENGPREAPQVALTFDLCERDRDSAGFDEKIVRILQEMDVKATFFMGGKWAETHPDAARMLGAEGLFEMANHSYSHKLFTEISGDEMKSQVLKAQDSIRRHTDATPRYFRYPAGAYNDVALRVVADCGLIPIQWDVVTGDPDPNVKAAAMIREVKSRARNGSIIIMHANGRGRHTAEALPTIIDELRGKGFELVMVSELLGEGS